MVGPSTPLDLCYLHGTSFRPYGSKLMTMTIYFVEILSFMTESKRTGEVVPCFHTKTTEMYDWSSTTRVLINDGTGFLQERRSE